MNVLIACEESQRVCIEFRQKGNEAYSCDIEPCSGGHPEWHIQNNVIPLLNGRCKFLTSDGIEHEITDRWDMIIAFPPCTHLAASGATYFEQKRLDGRQKEGIEFFCNFLTADCDKVSIENPIGIMSGNYVRKHFPELCTTYGLPIKPNQIIQPYEYGDNAKKATCLWLKGLPNLQPTNIVDPGEMFVSSGSNYSVGSSSIYATDESGKILRYNDPLTAKIRSKTFPGIAKAMAEQLG